MFTGLIETVGEIKTVARRGGYSVFTVGSEIAAGKIKIGESIACDGACLTVVDTRGSDFEVEASPETLSRTIAGSYAVGTKINLERALKTGDRLGGHFVSGHIDCVGVVGRAERRQESVEIEASFEPEFDALVVEKGSIAINGISLTINQRRSGGVLVNLIPHTIKSVNFAALSAGSRVNLEFDLIGKYALRRDGQYKPEELTFQKLKESGW